VLLVLIRQKRACYWKTN